MIDPNEVYADRQTPAEHAMFSVGSHAASLDAYFMKMPPETWTMHAICAINELVAEGARSHIAARWVEDAIERVTSMQERQRVDAERKPRR